MSHERLARLYYASGYSCEQAVFGAFARELGLSPVKAMQMAPKRKERTEVCGAMVSGIAVLKMMEDGEGSREASAARLAEFRRRFVERHGTAVCEKLRSAHSKERNGCDDIIGAAAWLIERMIEG